MKRLHIYVDSSVIGGCEDPEFSEDNLALWRLFIKGDFVQVLSAHTLRELQDAPEEVRSRILEVPEANQIILEDSPEAYDLADAYLNSWHRWPRKSFRCSSCCLGQYRQSRCSGQLEFQAYRESGQDPFISCRQFGTRIRTGGDSYAQGGAL